MKKILLALLVLVLIVGAGVGGYFISDSGILNSENKVTETRVADKIDEFCKSAGWLGVEEQTVYSEKQSNQIIIEQKPVNSNHAESYLEDEVDYKGSADGIKMMLFVAKYTLLSDNVKEDTFYISTATHTINQSSYTGTMGLYYHLGQEDAVIYLYDFENGVTVSIIVGMQPQRNDNYVLTVLIDGVFGVGGLSRGIELMQLLMDQNAETIYQFSHLWMKTEVNDFSDLQLDEVSQLYLWGCDINTDTSISLNETNIVDEDVYTFDALKNVLVTEKSKTTGVSFGMRDYIEIDALKDAYRAIGYQVVE